jgi:hypothetical protein
MTRVGVNLMGYHRPSMRRARLLAFLLALGSTGCATMGLTSYRDVDPGPAPALTRSMPSPEADALVARFYAGADPAAMGAALAEAIQRAPDHPGLREAAGYEALLRGDERGAFEHFLRAAADLNAISPELSLWEMGRVTRTTREHLRAEALYRAIANRDPRPAVRDLAAYSLAQELRLRADLAGADAAAARVGFIAPWSIVGAFDNDQNKGFFAEYPPEQLDDKGGEYTGVRVPIRWRPLEARRFDGALPLGDVVAPSSDVVAYASTHVYAATARGAELRITTTDAVRAWVNGRLVASDDKIHEDAFDNVIARIELAAGWNRILVKSAHRGGVWRLAARVTEAGGAHASDLRFAAAASGPVAPASASGAKPTLLSHTARIDALGDKLRRRFLAGRFLARLGRTKQASHLLEPLAAAAPRSPAATLFAAIALWDNAQAGKALDLLNRGAVEHPWATAFTLHRGRCA